MRIISYNILDGGEGRADPLAEVIEAQRADVVALVEATDLSVIERIANRLGFDFVQAPGKTQSSELLTRYTIRESINHALLRPGLSKSLLEATVVDERGQEWGVGVVHLHHYATEKDEAEREKERAVVLDVFEPFRKAGRPHILCGDFNADSPVQQIDPQKCKASTRKAWEENGGYVPRRVIATLLASGYTDNLHALRSQYAMTPGTLSTPVPGLRAHYAV